MSKAHWTSFKQHCRSVVMPDITFHDNSRQNSEHLTHAIINSAILLLGVTPLIHCEHCPWFSSNTKLPMLNKHIYNQQNNCHNSRVRLRGASELVTGQNRPKWDTIIIVSDRRYSGCLSQAIRPEWFDKSTRHLHLHIIWVKSSCIFMSNRWSGGADLTLSIFQCLTVRSPIWP